MKSDVFISIVIPFYNEEGNLNELVSQIDEELKNLNLKTEIILVDDGSTDNSLLIASKIIKKNNNISCIELSKNFGQEKAILAGLEKANGKVIITMDSDLQHPPSLIPELIKKYNEGFDVVNTTRIDTIDNVFKKKIISRYYNLINRICKTNFKIFSFNFRLFSREFVNDFIKLKEKQRFDRGLIEWLGYKQCHIKYHANKRYSGKTKYSLKKLFTRGIDSVFNYSNRPLRIIFYFSMIFFILSLSGALYTFVSNMIQGNFKHMIWSYILAANSFIFLFIGLISEYISSIYAEVKNRPLYVIKKFIE